MNYTVNVPERAYLGVLHEANRVRGLGPEEITV